MLWDHRVRVFVKWEAKQNNEEVDTLSVVFDPCYVSYILAYHALFCNVENIMLALSSFSYHSSHAELFGT